MTSAQDILNYWIGELDKHGRFDESRYAIWFTGGPAVDAEITERFGAALEEAAAGGLTEWEATPHGKLALIILCDQMSRNVWRGSARAFSLDARAYALAQGMIAAGEDVRLHLIERAFIYLPLEHHEGMEAQDQVVALFEGMAGLAPEAQRELFKSLHSYAVSHRDIIAQFGRYPHRNEALGRETTAAEAAFLEHGPRFGQ